MEVATRTCRACKEAKPLLAECFQWVTSERYFRRTCKACDNVRQRRWSEVNPEKTRQYASDFYAKNRERMRVVGRGKAAKDREGRIAYNRQWRVALKAEMHAAYGGLCACCGETEPMFLTLEHSRRDGGAHRRRIGGQMKVYTELRRQGWPKDGYELLCWNCQMATSRGAACPHTKAVTVAA